LRRSLAVVVLLGLARTSSAVQAAPSTSGAPGATTGPIAFGRSRLGAAAGEAERAIEVAVEPGRPPESFSIAPRGMGAVITGSDEVGAMYGLLELAERVRREGLRAFGSTKVEATPFLRDRGLNVFLTLPWAYDKNDTDYDQAALVDPQRWWFQNDDYWTTLLDLMAESRLNWLDIHGTWDVSVTDAPNLYAYFIQSDLFPEVGVAPEIKAKNLQRLNEVIEQAHARGIRVSLMAYEARLSTPHRRDPPYSNDEATAYAYTRDVVERMIRQAPGLDAIGFRIGESGHGGDFFRCYGEAVAKSGRDIPLVTRSWVTRKAKVVPLARASSDFTVEIKYDGEQWAAPYPFSGGRVANWHSYSFEDYLSDSTTMVDAGDGDSAPRKLWPGNPVHPDHPQDHADSSGDAPRWPDQPYKIVWQVRANGTHRIFPFFEPEWVRRSIEPMKVGTASGFTIEPENAYYPASPRYYVADLKQLPCEWIHQRDELYLMQWGRLGYDPKTSDEVFEQRLRERFGEAAKPLSKGWRAASRIVPISLLAHAFGPDHRDHAPELEWGGTTREWIEGEGLDTHAFLPIREEIALRTTGGSDGRIGALDVADELEKLAATVEGQLVELNRTKGRAPLKARAHELRCALEQLARLGRYHAGRLRAAWWTALGDAAPGTVGARALASESMTNAWKAWLELSGFGGTRPPDPASSFYRPFTERLRMHTNEFTWRSHFEAISGEKKALEELAKAAGEEPAKARAASVDRVDRKAVPDAELSWKEEGAGREAVVVARVPAHGLDRAWLLSKPLPSSTFFHKSAMTKEGDSFVARFAREPWGHLLAAEIARGDAVRRIPDPLRATPWLVVPSVPGPTPLIYASEEALAHLDPARLDAAKCGTLVVAPRAWQFFRAFDPLTQRKLLDAVSGGMTLLVLQQDYTSNRYPLSWLPNPPKVENWNGDLFDPGSLGAALRLEVTRAPAIITQRFVASPGAPAWEVSGNGGLAHAKLGAGEIWMVQARLIQNLHLPGCARALLQLLRVGGAEKPIVLVDAGTEGNRYASSVIPDFLNAHELPFVTLGELIAREQGVASAEARPGRPWDDLVLGGRGPAQQQAFLDAQAKASAARPLAKSREEFESQRARQKELVVQALGLDPPPERTPLDARVVGAVERDGYRIEKVVFESRPGFPVTAHLYVPTDPALAGRKLPVIVNPHGHWQHKKLEPVVQQRLIQQALHGYLALIVDSPGFSFEGEAKIERRYAGSHFDFRNTLGSMNTTAVYVWDLVRALDWLETRPEADMTRVGITGASGGGLATLWAFAAEPRFTCAVPVCFATSLEVEPHNGCPCNHVPGTLWIGDRADALAVRAPAPIFVIGADDDREFPPAGTKRTGEKLQAIWSLFDANKLATWRVFHSQHDYNLEMVAAALGFFDRHLKGVGDGSPLPAESVVARPTEPDESAELFCMSDAAAAASGLTTMRELAVAKLAAATKSPRTLDAEAFVAANGGLPAGSARNVVARDASGRVVALPKTPGEVAKLAGEVAKLAEQELFVTFESEPGLTIPGLLWLPSGAPRGAVVLLSDAGKAGAKLQFGIDKLVLGGFACLAIDARGFGELAGIDLRLLVYRGTSPAFAAAIDVNRALQILRPLCPKLGVVADGPAASLAALSTALVTPDLAAIVGRNSMHEFADAFADEIPLLAIQPQADLLPPLSKLRSSLNVAAQWTFAGDRGYDLFAALLRLMRL